MPVSASTRAGAIALSAAMLLAPVALAGCSLVRGAVSDASGGKVDIGGASVPKDFPKEQVPLIDGTVKYGGRVSTGSATVWTVLIDVAGESAADTITAQLEKAGFAAPAQSLAATGAPGLVFEKDPFTVIVSVAKDSDGTNWLASYVVTEAGASASPTPAG